MAQAAASFECEPWRWKAEEVGWEGCVSVSVCVCVWRILRQENKRSRKGRETNVRAAVHEIKRYLQNSPACDALWQALLEVSLSLFLCVCRVGRYEAV